MHKEIAASFFAQKNGESQHKVYAIGNCHIDCGMYTLYCEVEYHDDCCDVI